MKILVINFIFWLPSFCLGIENQLPPIFKSYPIRGIDVSHHQGNIDWSRVSRSRFKFAYIKATEGGSFKDKRFLKNWLGASSNGVIVGAYHFFTFCKSGEEQFKNYKNVVPVKDGMLVPAIDLEFKGNCKRRPSRKEMIAEVDSFARGVKDHYRVDPILYVTKEFYEAYLKGLNFKYKLGVRSLLLKPDFPPNKDWVFWQFTNKGRIDGINGNVDINVFNGSIEDLSNYRIKLTP